MELPPSSVSSFTDLGLSKELEDREFRNQFFRTEREIDIPAQIKKLRKLRRMRQAQLAERAGTKQSAISRIETSQEAKWELETLVKLAEALDARLSVVIEPYEEVIARYLTEEATVNASAADDYGQPDSIDKETESAARWMPKKNIDQGRSGISNMSERHGISGH